MKQVNYINADILTSSDNLWAHGCNARGKFASGVAGLLRKTYPYSYAGYMDYYAKNGLQLGDVIFAKGDKTQPIIANCITQQNYGRDGRQYVNYEAIEKSIKTVMQYADDNNITNITLPKIGAGLGGGNWGFIEKIILNINNLHPMVNINVYSL